MGFGWVSLRQRAVGGAGGLLVFWYFYHSPSMALMHAAPGSARAFARFLLLFVVSVVLAWAFACFGKYFGPEEYDAVRTVRFSERTQAFIDEVHESSRRTEAQLRYQLNEAWRPPPKI
ncbi:sensory box/GGDEF family protein [Segniliparus rotundus DSM 44985]|uniref:Sensory box/GGDEF family protein n=1 Tax=Segniliparus rotundus (strain ATCC BAA-972 / CDC 1076 / CIP 108378 / DSM 44985 / JCM 13578) TaxID=640132 RepID=D6ZCW5_SEGRD|nr:sensory box/GGDEF family protein [Segniliparus rotundus DSM 44985]